MTTIQPIEAEKRREILEEIFRDQAATAARYKPVMSLDELKEREQILDYLVREVMREGVDYGWVPGTKPSSESKPGEFQAKPTLFKAGAERACAFFGYAPRFSFIEKVEEWTPERFGELVFYYQVSCSLEKDGKHVGEGLGSATTWESKYRYRKGERACPSCGAAAIIKGKAEYGGGWLCFAKKGGCGAKFADGDVTIEAQEVGRIANPDVADVVNVVLKMAQKRAYVAAVLTATGLSSRFTQDLEDYQVIDIQADQTAAAKLTAAPAASPSDPELQGLLERLRTADGRREAVTALCDRLAAAIGDTNADEEWGRLLARHKVENIEQFKSLKPLQAFVGDLLAVVRGCEAPKGGQ